MRKYIFATIASLCLLLSPVSSYSSEKLPNDFAPECFQYYDRVESFLLKSGTTYKIDINKPDFLLVQSGESLPYTPIISADVIVDSVPPFQDINDFNPKTFVEVDTGRETDFILNLEKRMMPGEFQFLYDIDLKYHKFEFSVSTNGDDYFQVTDKTIYDFPFQYFKVTFMPLNPERDIRESVKIREMMFRSSRKQYAFTAIDNTVLEIYSDHNCDSNFSWNSQPKQDIATDINTTVIYGTLGANAKYNTYNLQDRDNDWIEDRLDNCPDHYNPDQKDNNSDNKGNVCSDTDGDGILGYKDICPYTYNPKQYDINTNGIGDACEFDKDKDGIYDTVDNCITIVNPNQTDTDRDGIGDICDNCKYYNSDQLDADENGIGDICDSKNKTLEQNDKDDDGILDWADNCSGVFNPGQEDKDKDRVGDDCDNCKSVKNTDQTDKDDNTIGDICEDSDNDGLVGYLDNCIYIPNADQKDANRNGTGDICEDVDRDGKVYKNDNCPFARNPDQSDIDNDGLGDVCDNSDDRFIESNKSVFSLALVMIVLMFGFGIWKMYQKLNSTKDTPKIKLKTKAKK